MSRPSEPILVLAEDPETRADLARSLEDHGYRVLVVDGTGALGAASGGGARPGVAVVSVHADREEEVLGELQRDLGAGAGVLQIVDPGDSLRALEQFDSSDFLVRPHGPDELVARVGRLLETVRLNRQMIHQARDLHLLLELARQVTATLDVETMLFELVALLAQATGVSRCSLVLVDPGRRRGTVLATSDDRTLHDLEIDLDEYPEILEVIRTRQHLVLSDVQGDPVMSAVRDRLSELGGLALFPLTVDDQLVGVLVLRTAGDRESFTERDISLAAAGAIAVAIAVRNARLIQRIQSETEEESEKRRRVERQVEDLKQYEDLYQHVGEGILLVDSGGRISGANPAARELLEGDEGLDGRILATLGATDVDESVLEQLRLEPQQGVRREARVRRHSAEVAERVLSMMSSPLSAGSAVVSFRDVTDSRALEEELRKTKDFLSNLIDSSVDAIVAADIEGRIILWNTAAQRITGWSPAEAVGRLRVTDIYPEDTAYEVMERLRNPSRGGVGRIEEMRVDLLAQDGERIPVNLSAAILYEDGREVATMGIFTDLRERLRMKQRLSHAQDRLIKTEQQAMLAELAGTTAHELNQPLTSVMGYAELMRRKIPPDDPNHRAVDIIYRESERMAEIVRKIGRITRYETKEYLGNTRIVDLDASVEESE